MNLWFLACLALFVFRLFGAGRIRLFGASPARHFSLLALNLLMITHVFFNFLEWQLVAILFSRKRFAKRSGTRFPTHENVFAALSFLCAGEKNNAQMLITITCEFYLSPWPFFLLFVRPSSKGTWYA